MQHIINKIVQEYGISPAHERELQQLVDQNLELQDVIKSMRIEQKGFKDGVNFMTRLFPTRKS